MPPALHAHRAVALLLALLLAGPALLPLSLIARASAAELPPSSLLADVAQPGKLTEPVLPPKPVLSDHENSALGDSIAEAAKAKEAGIGDALNSLKETKAPENIVQPRPEQPPSQSTLPEPQPSANSQPKKSQKQSPPPPPRPKTKRVSIPVIPGSGYKVGKKHAVPAFCMRREIDNGEHVTDSDTGLIVFDPFPSMCKETKLPLSFEFGADSDGAVNCTFTVLDEVYHLLQLYVHQDSPLSCRVPARYGSSNLFAPLAIAMHGQLEHSHLDIATKLNVFFTYTEADAAAASLNITSAMAYPVTPSDTTRLIIGEDLTLQFNVRWFPLSRTPKQADRGVTSLVTVVYCVASATAAFCCSAFYFLTIVFPRRARLRSARQHDSAKFGSDFSMFGGGGVAFTSSSKRD